jgi:putative ABC transport system substrate-binding protein
MRRREFIGLLGGSVSVAWPCATRAQPSTIPVIGYLGSETENVFASRLRAFHQGLNTTGYHEGRNVAMEYRWAEGRIELLPALVAELVRRHVNVIVTPGTTASALAAKAATRTIPIVFETGTDPVAAGLVTSLNRPGGNITGITSLNVQLAQKRLELLHELVPAATSFALLVNPANQATATANSNEMQAVAGMHALQLHILNASTEDEFDGVFAICAEMRIGGLVIASESLFNGRSEQLAALALKYAVPTIHQAPEFSRAGGLSSYGGSIAHSHGQAGIYAGRILKGEKPGDLPVQQATKIELTINLKTAKALGLTIPLSLLGRADEVVE